MCFVSEIINEYNQQTWFFETFFTVNSLQVYGQQQKRQQMKYIISTLTSSKKLIQTITLKQSVASNHGGYGT